jgi:hypothetical protein
MFKSQYLYPEYSSFGISIEWKNWHVLYVHFYDMFNDAVNNLDHICWSNNKMTSE